MLVHGEDLRFDFHVPGGRYSRSTVAREIDDPDGEPRHSESVSALLGFPTPVVRGRKLLCAGRALAWASTWAETQNREWSSMPETILASLPSASFTPPTMSICHSFMVREPSRRLQSLRLRFFASG